MITIVLSVNVCINSFSNGSQISDFTDYLEKGLKLGWIPNIEIEASFWKMEMTRLDIYICIYIYILFVSCNLSY